MLIRPNRIRRLAFFVLLCVTWFNAAAGRSVEPISGLKKTVLVLYGDPLSTPADRMTEQGLTAALSSVHGWNLEVFSEYLDLMRFPAVRYGDDIARYLHARYGMRKPDVLITLVNTTLQFVIDHRDELFPDVPIVFTDVDHREVEGKEMPPNIIGLWMAWDYQRTLELAFQLQPKTREVVCVSGTGVEEQAWNKEARKVLERFGSRVRTRWLDKLPLQAVLDEVARLPLDSVVLYIPMQRDGAGQLVSPFEVARQLAEASRVPVYGLSLPQLQQGIIGGALLDFSEIGQKTAALAVRVLAGERLPVLSPPDPAANPLLINWRALKKWHVSESRIPGEATVLYREPSLWEQHRRLILATAAVVSLQSLLIVGLILQRSRRKRAEEALRESEQQMGLAASAAELSMWKWDILRDQIWMTNKGHALFGFAPDTRLDSAALTARVHPDDRAARDAVIRRALKTQGEYAMEYRIVLDGQVRWIAGRGRVEFAGGKPVLMRGISLDITERRQAELEVARQRNELAHRSRVMLLGELSGSLAHELNQPLGAIVTNAGAALRCLARDSMTRAMFREVLEDIVADGQRAGKVIRGIKGMLRKAEGARQLVDMNDVIAQTLRLTQSDALANDCAVLTEFYPALPKVEADVVQLQQVFLNLILNAFEASKDVPKLQRRVIIHTERDGDGTAVRACVRDFGAGLPAEASERVFEQFFSTKRDGMGMGLFISRSIVAAHRGTLCAENAADGGAQFWLRLPASKEIKYDIC
jgi:PAS domain S-box-containing protein